MTVRQGIKRSVAGQRDHKLVSSLAAIFSQEKKDERASLYLVPGGMSW